MVVFPLFADQSANAHAVVDAGAGVTVEARAGAAAHRTIHSDDTAALREAILQVLADPGYAEASATVRSAFSTLPLLDDVFDDIVTGRATAHLTRSQRTAGRRAVDRHRGRVGPSTRVVETARPDVGPVAYGVAMSAVHAATALALWGAAHAGGTASPDEVLSALAGCGPTAGVRAADPTTAARTRLPGPGEASASAMALLQLFRTGGRPRLMLPVPGDVRGLPPRSAALVPALDAGAAVVLPAGTAGGDPGERSLAGVRAGRDAGAAAEPPPAICWTWNATWTSRSGRPPPG